ncbi:MAG: hypothetical protein K0R48_1238 [Gammaproteobacteria bacterium]|nr:hypothetical protein [Gammaproteobacteria bacterium]
MNSAEQFKQSGYVIIRSLLDPDTTNRLYAYILSKAELGNKDDGQVPGSPSFYQDKEVVALQKKLLPSIEAHIQYPLLNVFCYHRVYKKGAILRSHKDSIRAEISVTINLGQRGEPWDIWLMDYDENAHKVALGPGDALIYQGSQLAHWRGKLEHADDVAQIMFHYVARNGKHTSAARWEFIGKIRKKYRELLGLAY